LTVILSAVVAIAALQN